MDIEGFATILYVNRVAERDKSVLKNYGMTSFKPVSILGHIFKKPKDRPSEFRKKGIVYKVKCKSCSFNYIGESKRSWKSRGAERKPGSSSNKESAMDHGA